MVYVPAHTTQSPRRHGSKAKNAPVKITPRQRVAGVLLRSVFIVLLLIALVHLSMPQSGTIWTIFDRPGDLVRLALGVAMGAWVGIQLFTMPVDPLAFRTWLFTGLAAVPFLVICMIGTW